MLTRSKKRLDYKKLGETGGQEEEEEEIKLNGEEEADRGEAIGEVSKLSNLLKRISISEDMQLVFIWRNMSQEKIDVLPIEQSTIADDVSDFIDGIQWKTC